jgi:hypothetical protein
VKPSTPASPTGSCRMPNATRPAVRSDSAAQRSTGIPSRSAAPTPRRRCGCRTPSPPRPAPRASPADAARPSPSTTASSNATGSTTPGSRPAGRCRSTGAPSSRAHRRQPLPAPQRQPRLLPTDRARRDRPAHGHHPHRAQPRQPARLAHQDAGSPSRGRSTSANPSTTDRSTRPPGPAADANADRLTGPARTTHPARRRRQPARKRPETAKPAPRHTRIGTDAETVSDRRDPATTKLPAG